MRPDNAVYPYQRAVLISQKAWDFDTVREYVDVVNDARKNAKKGIKALHRLQEHAARGRSLAIAPEGTRSKTGLLNGFKKGPFHMQGDTGLGATPCIVFGAYELWPPSQPFALSGQVVVRFLPQRPTIERGGDRDAARLALRRLFLRESARDVPPCAGKALTWPQAAQLCVGYVLLYGYLRGTWAVVRWIGAALRWSGWHWAAAAAAFESFIYVKEILL